MVRPTKPRSIGEFEGYIKVRAKAYAKKTNDIEDFEQVGRLAAWSAIQDDPYCTKSYAHQRIEWRMRDFWKRGIYKNPEELSANEYFGNKLWGEYIGDDDN